MKICPKCSTENDEENKYCTSCASPLKEVSSEEKYSVTPSYSSQSLRDEDSYISKTETKGKKEPLIMGLLSLFIPGLGQMLIGQMAKGAGILVGTVILTCITGGFLWLPIGLFSAIDSYKLTEKINEGNTPGEMEFFFQNK